MSENKDPRRLRPLDPKDIKNYREELEPLPGPQEEAAEPEAEQGPEQGNQPVAGTRVESIEPAPPYAQKKGEKRAGDKEQRIEEAM